MNSGKKHNRILEKLILPKESRRKRHRNENEFDATRPIVLFWLTISYIAIVAFLILGIPWMGLEREPILPEDLPVAITTAAIFYVLIIGGLYIRDKLNK